MNYLPSAIGLDLEWPFTSNRVGGCKEGKVALVQLCDADIILLIQVSKMASAYIWLLRGHECTNFSYKGFPRKSKYGSFLLFSLWCSEIPGANRVFESPEGRCKHSQ
jgi:hypothetical protein